MQSWQLGSVGWGCTEPVVWTTLSTTCGRCHNWVGIPMWSLVDQQDERKKYSIEQCLGELRSKTRLKHRQLSATMLLSLITLCLYMTWCIYSFFFCFDTAPSFEAWETHRYLKNRLGIVRARGGGLLDHPYAPCHPPSVPPTEEHLIGHLTNYCRQMSSCGLYILFLYWKIGEFENV